MAGALGLGGNGAHALSSDANCQLCLFEVDCVYTACQNTTCTTQLIAQLLDYCADTAPANNADLRQFASTYGDLITELLLGGYEPRPSCEMLGACEEASYTCTSSNCTSTAWTANGTGYETRTYKYCSDSTTCTSQTQYQCAANYYGSSTNGTSGCTACPSGGKSTAGSTVRTACYLSTGTTFNDSTGNGIYDGNCYFTE